VSINHGAHELKLGGDYRRLLPTTVPSQYGRTLIFPSVAAVLTNKIPVLSIFEKSPAELLLDNLSFYAQDAWHASKRLTLTYGIRWDLNPAPSTTSGSPLLALANANSPQTVALAPSGTELYKTRYNNFAPRIGVAYSIRDNGSTVLRGGFGVFYDLGEKFTLTQATGSFPFSRSKTAVNVAYPIDPSLDVAPPPTITNPFTSTLTATDPTLRLPFTLQWNATIEQALGANQSLSIAYVGANGHRLLRLDDFFRPNPSFTSFVNVEHSDAFSRYSALQVQFRRRLSGGLQVLASYTWSHSIDDASNFSQTAPAALVDPRTNTGSSDFDLRHSFTSGLSYAIPKIPNAMFRPFLRDWELDSVFFAHSATPVNVITGAFNPSVFGGASQVARPDVVPGVPQVVDDPSVPGGWRINAAAFDAATATAQNRQGTLGRNALRGFPAWESDLALQRQFSLTDRFKLLFRSEFFNLFNHPNFANPNGTLTTPSTFGVATQMLGRGLGSGGVNGGLSPLYQVGGPRSIQLALKLQF
jgi:hypothetical protein